MDSWYGLERPKAGGEHTNGNVDGQRIAVFIITSLDQITSCCRLIRLCVFVFFFLPT
jgi:hypothetical protein